MFDFAKEVWGEPIELAFKPYVVAILADGRMVVSEFGDPRLRVIEGGSPVRTRVVFERELYIKDVGPAPSPGHVGVLTMTKDKQHSRFRILDAATWRTLKTLELTVVARKFCFDDRASRVAIHTYETVQVWSLETDQMLSEHTLPPLRAEVALSGDGARVALRASEARVIYCVAGALGVCAGRRAARSAGRS